MNAVSPPGACAHCAAPLPAGLRFCCAGCEGAHGIVSGLGLDAFYRRRAAAAGAQRPDSDAPPPPPLAAHARPEADGGTHAIDLLVSGMTCGACAWLLEAALRAEGDVLRARASLSARRLSLRWRGPAGRADGLARLVAALGFRVAPWSEACLRAATDEESRLLLRALGVAAFGAVNVMVISFAVWAGTDMGAETRAMLHRLAAAIALPVVAYAGLPFFRSAADALRAGRVNMDAAISLAVLATTAMSASEALRGGRFTWFDSATSLLALLLAGRVLDRAARGRARGAVAELLALRAGEVRLLAPDGTVRAAPVEAVRAGDRVMVASGERLRLDGALDGGGGEGASAALLDTSAATGESLPRRFGAGESLPAAALNLGPPFAMTVSRAAADGSIARMAALVEEAEAAKGRVATLADRAARLYVPAVLAVSAATFALWAALGAGWQDALVNAVAVLIVTCPCGLAIAVPAARVAAVGALFRRGVLVRTATALERLAAADRVVLDKTGTLTLGRPVLLPDPARPDAALRAAASLARASRHPLARALAAACPDAPAPPAGVAEVPGRGLSLGDARLGSAAHCGLPAVEPDGMALWYVAAPGAPPVRFRFADAPRPDAADAVAALRALGLEVELLSGDGEGATAAAARAAGIEAWRSGASPEGKAARVRELAGEGHRVLAVGDGINDVGALAAAHASASPADATDIAQAAADLVLTGASLAALPEAVAAARRAERVSRQGLALALAYNAVAVPAAVAGLVTPLGAALVMATSSLAVTGNALRAGRFAGPRFLAP